ncbi:MAG: hypothetical protein ABI729_08890 [Chitinophagales bacterium]
MDALEIYDEHKQNSAHYWSCATGISMFLTTKFYEDPNNNHPIISSRVKGASSVVYKIEHSKSPISSINELHDLIGLRLICISESIVEEISGRIQSWMNIIDIENTRTRLGENQFGYSSVHLIGQVDEALSEEIEKYRPGNYVGLYFEIQVRTMAQHIFADLSHKYSYKSGKYIPGEIKRPLYRIAALSEIMDNEINSFEEARAKYLEEYIPVPEDEINIDSLRILLKRKFEPFRDKQQMEDLDGLMKDLEHFKIKRITDLEILIDKHYKAYRQFEIKSLHDGIAKHGAPPGIKDLVDNNYIHSLSGAVRGILQQEFKGEWDAYSVEHVQKPIWKKLREFLKEMPQDAPYKKKLP